MVCTILLRGQDKLYLLDGSMRLVKVLQIAPDYITIVPLSESGAPFRDANEVIAKTDVLFIEYKGGLIEVYTSPQKSFIYNPNGTVRKDITKDEQEFSFNFASLNTLALCNADLAGFFEHLVPSKIIGVGGMAAYNFNRNVILPNNYMNLLNNAKKNYDAGLFLNFYPGHFKRKVTFYFGAMLKYTSFSFSKVVSTNTGQSTILTYEPAKGSQLATLVDVGFHARLGKNMFLKTIAGLGAFRLKGDYKQQVNYYYNSNNTQGDPVINYSILPKIYLGLNFGFSF
ncbi:hypothetical protein CNR22_07975 [Sphingobacteriaceae bacterium]|nr:hypothetical protein CNR22_07975 [Sphingobacteriaceae bacterium]